MVTSDSTVPDGPVQVKPLATADDRRAAVVDEYGQYVATEAIDFGNARAFNIGDPVPKSHVDRGVVRADQVTSTAKKG